MAMAAFRRACRYAQGHSNALTAGVACTAALATDRPRRGSHRAHVALQTAAQTACWSVELEKGRRGRAAEELLVGRLLLNVVAEAEGTGIRVSWDFVPEDDVFRYRLYRREQSEPDYETIGFVWFNENSYLDQVVTKWVTYCYAVVAIDTSGNESGYSNEDCATAGVYQEPQEE